MFGMFRKYRDDEEKRLILARNRAETAFKTASNKHAAFQKKLHDAGKDWTTEEAEEEEWLFGFVTSAANAFDAAKNDLTAYYKRKAKEDNPKGPHLK